MNNLVSKKAIAMGLLKMGAVKFSPRAPFTYASGLKGPMYCDNRMVLTHVEFRNEIVNCFIEAIKNLKYDLIGGIATAGIPHAAFVADRLNVPMVYVRPKPKGHGKMNQVEGDFKEGMSVLLFEDLVNQGASLVDAVNGTAHSKLIVYDCCCIVDYQMSEANKRLNDLKIKLHSLTDFSILVEVALELELINKLEKTNLELWHQDPIKWSNEYI